MIEFAHPEAFLLLVPAALLLRRALWPSPGIGVLRVALLLALCTLLAEPWWRSGESGRDLVLAIDRSRSVGELAAQRAAELAQAAASSARPGDRIAVVGFGRDAVVESPAVDARTFELRAADRVVDADGTDLSAALDTALGAIQPGRTGSIVVVSDGDGTGGSALPAARAAARRDVRVDAYQVRRAAGVDVAIESVALPGEVASGEPFRIVAWIRSDASVDVPVRLVRDGEVVAEMRKTVAAGSDRAVFVDVLATPGVHRYEVAIDVDGDAVAENDRALAVTRALGPDRVLVVSPGGRRGRLASALVAAGIDVVVAAPQAATLDLDSLDGVRAVVLENVPAEDLPRGSLDALRSWVEDLGGSLLMTGGRASFGLGGYRRSPIEDVLPVSMEIRKEQRRFGIAMAIVLDRSGSMMAPAGTGQTKMDLADLGAIAAIEMLGPIDDVSVIAVDSVPHVVVPRTTVDDRARLSEEVRKIESGGGGIFVGVGLEAAARELADADQEVKHIILFADAADSEEPGDYEKFVPKLRGAGVTVSVIGLGGPTDSDARLLLDIARLGGGRCKFVLEARHLPQLFAQETIEVARSSFADDPVQVAVHPDLLSLGAIPRSFPGVGGYSIAWPEPDASIGLTTVDEFSAPMLAFWQRGLGRSAAFLGEVDGKASGELASWDGFGPFFVTLVRWLSGRAADRQVWADLRREGHEAVLVVELGEGEEARVDDLTAVMQGPNGAKRVWLERIDARRFEARVPMRGDGVYRAAVSAGDDAVVTTPPVALPYSPEFEPRPPGSGTRSLEELCAAGGGRVDPPLADLFAGPRLGTGLAPAGAWFAWASLVLLLLEITVRRLAPRLRLRLPAWSRPTRPAAPAAAEPEPSAPAAPDLGSILDRARRRAKR